MDAFGVIKQPLLRSSEQPHREKSAFPSSRHPAGDLQGVLGNQRRRRTLPVRLIRELDFASGRDRIFHFILEKLFAVGVVGKADRKSHTSELQSHSFISY